MPRRPLPYRWSLTACGVLAAALSVCWFLYLGIKTGRACMATGDEPTAQGLLILCTPIITGILSSIAAIVAAFGKFAERFPVAEATKTLAKVLPEGRLDEVKKMFDTAATDEERDIARSLGEVVFKQRVAELQKHMTEMFPANKPDASA